jgi:hypothetical protein
VPSGILATYRSVAFAVVKVVSFVLVDPYEKRDTRRRWKDVPFAVQDFDETQHLQVFQWQFQQSLRLGNDEEDSS